MTKNREKAATILGLFEEYLNNKEVKIPNKERDEAIKEGDTSLAIIYGKEYYELEDGIVKVLENMDEKSRIKIDEIRRVLETEEEEYIRQQIPAKKASKRKKTSRDNNHTVLYLKQGWRERSSRISTALVGANTLVGIFVEMLVSMAHDPKDIEKELIKAAKRVKEEQCKE